jgi:nucleotide-binding universal stress UspA family protein
MYSRILVPLDGSTLAETILPHASEVARCFGATVVLFRATTSYAEAVRQTASPEPLTSATLSPEVADRLVSAGEEAAEAYLTRMREALAAQGLQADCIIAEGDPSATLVAAVKNQHIDLLAMATHGRSAFGRLFKGSVAEDVLRDIDVPVLLIRAKE